MKRFLFSWGILFLLFCCDNNRIDYLESYKNHKKEVDNQNYQLYRNNSFNLKNNYPFYIICQDAPFYLTKPDMKATLPDNFILLDYGDILFPVEEENPIDYFYYVKTIDNKLGWIHSNYGISLNYDEDPNLYFFSDRYYLKNYLENNGEIDSSNKIILTKNIVPLLLGNFETDGWFYPQDPNLALKLTKFAVDIAEDKQTFMYAASSYDWRVNEVVITYNLLADCYQRLNFIDKAEEIHLFLIKRYFWKRSDNSRIGGLNSIVKLEMIYLERLKNEPLGSKGYKEIQDQIIENILVIGDKYNKFTIADMKWNLTAAEWLLDILRRNVSREEFYDFSDKISRQTSSQGYSDMVNIYAAIEMYKDGRKEEALSILTSIKPRHHFKSTLRINDWLSANKVIPDSIIYQYKF